MARTGRFRLWGTLPLNQQMLAMRCPLEEEPPEMLTHWMCSFIWIIRNKLRWIKK